MRTFSCHQRLAKLRLESLELERLRADLLFTHKLVFGIINLKLSDFFSFLIFTELAAATDTYYTYQPVKTTSDLTATPYRVMSIWNEVYPT